MSFVKRGDLESIQIIDDQSVDPKQVKQALQEAKKIDSSNKNEFIRKEEEKLN